MAIDKGNSNAMFYLGWYYQRIEKNYDLMKKYFFMAIDKGHPKAMNRLGSYYEEKEKDYVNMKRYYLMAINIDNLNAMNNLGLYYQYREIDYDMMKKYYFMAIDKGYPFAITNLENYYKEHNLFVEKIIDFHQHDVKIIEKDVTEMFEKCKMTDEESINLIRIIDLRSYKNCPEYIKSMQDNYVRDVRNELDACVKCPKELINLTIDFFI